ncbi:MAG: Sulfate adenylyltransferase [Candidatus Moranbacteria bacterium GW2011_GWE2_35_2-]|nr:MAG: Sulfate adenylyltransferase [Candidatus Moranbacteria bacterium GW2011_GWE2_35_2-]KKQ06813.1 MAG: Sulfate adenylyltransferase [Candidatus Moranbacteria bacterium GW2011_GWF1_36_4]KKQ22873.1 MAG: Sulfate adenylyltransferase [Candidatus Moranbacteria bacterium GW2011_GWF2_37_11]KKQ29231.1 MAG: Sulfate adenylyltransferase [Candidatus Moranbacteria bacterium GW2011_GWD1_37_17]KKQ30896.1 MAG: Sulfate adenylyltransferase [Candidatus Moranbacteria bacterium GW2011_GWE1_37_24]HBO16908.1 sulfat
MKKIKASDEIIQEARNIVDGLYFPLQGFLNEDDLRSILENMRLKSGQVWSMPVVFDISENEAQELKNENSIIITNKKDEFFVKDISIFKWDREFFVKNLYGTLDGAHPGVERAMKMKKFLLSGKVEKIRNSEKPGVFHLTSEQAKDIFKKNGWANVVAFQTRNPPHRSHEHLQKTALAEVDGILINPVIGSKKSGDFRDKHIIGAYQKLIKHHYEPGKAVLGTLHTFMRYAGPREAVFHALVRRNLGCTHMIIGRDHAGVGDYYGTYDAQKIFDNFTEDELGIRILRYENVTYCQGCGDMSEDGSCDHSQDQKIHLSGTKLREKLNNNEEIPEEFMRKEVIEYLKDNKDDLFV